MTDGGSTGSAQAEHDWHAELLQHFRLASGAAGISEADAELLAAIVGDLADCSAQECVTFLLPALDRHAGRPADEAGWSPVDAAVLRGLPVALPHVRPRQRLRTLGICLEALLRRLAIAAPADAQREDPPASLPAIGAVAPCDPAMCLSQPGATQPAGADIARDVSEFVLHSAEQLRDHAVTALVDAVSKRCVRFVCFALAALATLAATLPQHGQHGAAADSSGSSYINPSMASNPVQEAYGPHEPTAASLLWTLPLLGCSSVEDLHAIVRGPSTEEADDDESADAHARLTLGQAAVVHAAFCCPAVVILQLPDDPDSGLSLALGATQARAVLPSASPSLVSPCSPCGWNRGCSANGAVGVFFSLHAKADGPVMVLQTATYSGTKAAEGVCRPAEPIETGVGAPQRPHRVGGAAPRRRCGRVGAYQPRRPRGPRRRRGPAAGRPAASAADGAPRRRGRARRRVPRPAERRAVPGPWCGATAASLKTGHVAALAISVASVAVYAPPLDCTTLLPGLPYRDPCRGINKWLMPLHQQCWPPMVRSARTDAQMDVLEELLGSPYPSVAAVLLQLLRELVAARMPPPRRALDMAANWLEVRPTHS